MVYSESEESAYEEEDAGRSKFAKGYNKYGTEDPILAAAEEALDNGLFDSEGNMDSEGFEGLFGSKFDDEDGEEEDDEDLSEEGSEDPTEEEVELSEEEEEDLSEEEEEIVEPAKKQAKPTIPNTSEEAMQLQKQVKGLLNRLSLGNFESIATSMEALYGTHPRRLVTEIITDLVLTAITSQPHLLDSFVLVFAALIATLGHLVGVEFAAFVLQRCVEILTEENSKVSVRQMEEEVDGPTPARIVMNLTVFLSFLYDLQIVSNKVIGDLIQEAVDRLNELDTEVILKLVRNCGAQFRRDDPSTLKSIILKLNERVASIPKEKQSSRFAFMLESIYDLKNNKVRATQLQQGDLEKVKKLLRGLAQQRSISKFEPLRIGLEDIRQADTRGRWWLVGGTWSREADDEAKRKAKAKETATAASEIDTLAKEQRMNTDVRKAIFRSIVASEDCIDAFQRLLGLKLTSKQERDIPMVILHCCGQEKTYNPFYALLAQKFIKFKHNYLITFKYAFWDWLKQIEEASLRKLSHMAQFYGSLFLSEALPLNSLKKVDFLHLSEKESIFLQMILAKVLTEASEETLTAIFEGMHAGKKKKNKRASGKKIDIFGDNEDDFFDEANLEDDEESQKQKQDLDVMKAGLSLFLAFHLKNKQPAQLPFVKDYKLLHKRIDYVSVYLKQQH